MHMEVTQTVGRSVKYFPRHSEVDSKTRVITCMSYFENCFISAFETLTVFTRKSASKFKNKNINTPRISTALFSKSAGLCVHFILNIIVVVILFESDLHRPSKLSFITFFLSFVVFLTKRKRKFAWRSFK